MPTKKPPPPVEDTVPRSYMGGSYLNVMLGKLTITQVSSRWGDKESNTGSPSRRDVFLGFRGYRMYKNPRGIC